MSNRYDKRDLRFSIPYIRASKSGAIFSHVELLDIVKELIKTDEPPFVGIHDDSTLCRARGIHDECRTPCGRTCTRDMRKEYVHPRETYRCQHRK